MRDSAASDAAAPAAPAPERQPFTLASEAGHTLHGVIHWPRRRAPAPAVVVCHGFKGFMDWGFFPPLADLLADRGMVAVRFNHSGCGMRPGDELVTDPDAFRHATFGKDVDETRRVLRALADGELAAGRVDPRRLGLVGHSRGGGTAVVAAAHPEWRGRLRALVTWAAVASFRRFDAATIARWRTDGSLPITNARTGQELAIDAAVLAEVEARADLDPLAAAAERRAPWLLVHGDDDESVPVAEGEALRAAAREPAELQRVAGGSHTFGARHPFQGPTRELVTAMNATQTWLRRHLS